MTSNYVPGLRLEFARFYGETGDFKLNFCIENSNSSQFFVSGIHIYTFSHNFAGKKISFHRHFKLVTSSKGRNPGKELKITRIVITMCAQMMSLAKVSLLKRSSLKSNLFSRDKETLTHLEQKKIMK